MRMYAKDVRTMVTALAVCLLWGVAVARLYGIDNASQYVELGSVFWLPVIPR